MSAQIPAIKRYDEKNLRWLEDDGRETKISYHELLDEKLPALISQFLGLTREACDELLREMNEQAGNFRDEDQQTIAELREHAAGEPGRPFKELDIKHAITSSYAHVFLGDLSQLQGWTQTLKRMEQGSLRPTDADTVTELRHTLHYRMLDIAEFAFLSQVEEEELEGVKEHPVVHARRHAVEDTVAWLDEVRQDMQRSKDRPASR